MSILQVILMLTLISDRVRVAMIRVGKTHGSIIPNFRGLGRTSSSIADPLKEEVNYTPIHEISCTGCGQPIHESSSSSGMLSRSDSQI